MTKPDVYQMVTDKILESLDAGVVPWHKPWTTHAAMNAVTGRAYSGVNVWLLGLTAYNDPRWITYKKAKEIGGNPRKGEKSTFVVFWNISKKTDDEGNEKKFFFLKYFNVFNVEQCENLEEKKLVDVPEKKTNISLELAEAIVSGMPNAPKFSHGGDTAFYRPGADSITIPAMDTFESSERYYGTRFHEMSHSTGHASRLDRDIKNEFGCGDYSKEELVAEFGSSFLCAHAEIHTTIEQNAAYIAGWRKVLSMDKKMVVSCASKGQKAAEYILNVD